ncbi:uncharacterized protein LOC134235901 [Saccostrea cucullata]|uniref:uncharacterized protein LOC134235901 n=1 Tax=Saccostrea cuccullata TaxID=36930 RepID=UPI002ED1DB10
MFVFLLSLTVSMITGEASQCCVPPQFQTNIDTMTSLSSTMDKRFQTARFSYDAMSKKLRTHVVAQTKEDEFDRIEDFSAGKSFTWARGICKVSSTGPFNQICIPDEAKLVRESFMGVSPNIIKLKTYMVTLENNMTELTTVGDNCTPIEMVSFSSKSPQPDGQFMRIFYNMSMGIKDSSIFTPPKICS